MEDAQPRGASASLEPRTAINRIGDQIKSHLASVFSSEATSPPSKHSKLEGKRQASPEAILFDKPQAKWLQHALCDTLAVFGNHIDQRLQTVESQVAAVSAKVDEQSAAVAELTNLKDQVQDIKAELAAVKTA